MTACSSCRCLWRPSWSRRHRFAPRRPRCRCRRPNRRRLRPRRPPKQRSTKLRSTKALSIRPANARHPSTRQPNTRPPSTRPPSTKSTAHKGAPAPLSLAPGALRGTTTAAVPNPAGRATGAPPAPAMPPPLLRSTPALAMATSAATSPLDLNALKQAVDLVGKSRSDEAANLESTISDPLARKLVEWLILRSDDTDRRLRALCRVHRRQSELAEHRHVAPAGGGDAVAGAQRPDDRARASSRPTRRAPPRASSRWRARCSPRATVPAPTRRSATPGAATPSPAISKRRRATCSPA